MNVLLFEWLTGGGLLWESLTPDARCPMQDQGQRMLQAVVEDFSKSGFCTTTFLDDRLPGFETAAKTVSISSRDELPILLQRVATDVDHVLLIAPETDGCLLQVIKWIGDGRKKMISPSYDFVELTTNKTRTCEILTRAGIRCPHGRQLDLNDWRNTIETFPLPFVLKRNDGAGSRDLFYIEDQSLVEQHVPALLHDPPQFRIEEFISGTSVSVSVVGSSHGGFSALEPSRQVFDAEPIGCYQNSVFDLPKSLCSRAIRLANRVARALPKTQGYFGIDLVLGASSTTDTVIEVNPRLTSSYCQLRERMELNLATLCFDSRTDLPPAS